MSIQFFEKRKRGLKIVVLTILSVLLGWFIIYLFSRASLETSFGVNAKTESVLFNSGLNSSLIWHFNDVKLLNGRSQEIFTGGLSINDSVDVFVERKSLGACIIRLTSHGKGSVGSLLKDDQYSGKLEEVAYIFIDSIYNKALIGKTMILPLNGINGKLTTGTPVGNESSYSVPILREGSVTLLNTSFNGKNTYKAAEYELKSGDRFIINDRKSPYYGFLSLDERPCITLTYKVSGASGLIERPGGIKYPVESTLLSKFQYDAFYQWLSLFFGILVFFGNLLALKKELKNFNK